MKQIRDRIANHGKKLYDIITRSVTTRTTFLMSSSVAFLKSWSNGLASSLKSPTSSQFFKKRVGVGVWSAVEKNLQYKSCHEQYQLHPIISTAGALTSNDDTVIPCWTKLQGHLMFMFVDSQVILICKSLC